MQNQDTQKQEQFLRLLMLNDKSIYAYIISLVRNTNDADDIMQDTSGTMWRKFSNFKEDMDFVAWAITIARYQTLSYFKKRKNSKLLFSDDLTRSIEQEVERSALHQEERLNALKSCVKKLNSLQRNMLKLRYEKGYTIENIGAHISKSTSATFYTFSKIHKLLLQCVRETLGKEAL